MNLHIVSLVSGFLGCFFVIYSFICQLIIIYKTKNADGTSWGLISCQILTSVLFCLSAGINVYLDGIMNLPFLVANGVLFLLFILIAYLKIKYTNDSVIF